MENNNIYAPPQSELNSNSNQSIFFPSSTKKLLILYFATFGLYNIYWFYKHWIYQKPYMENNIWPIPRAIFSIFFTHSLFKRIAQKIPENKEQFKYSVLATIYIFASILTNLIDRISAQSNHFGIMDIVSFAFLALAAYPLYMAQYFANKANNDPQGNLNNKLSIYNYIFIALGLVFWLFLGLLVVDPSLSILSSI